ncbi:argininosuccinate lyase [Streptomyces noursei]|uniref:argininosuccinate lyase n=1 Tax=Streptomyces noursei TaxID=1971 RepID=UPI00167AD774|nr:argininosuccinate lyase [Streptomyces noursei]MCZ1013286.1 argininosuccinate lyase [Streptomyces noursei]GGX53470.1 argininosuccinate lyase [Streptomyces noursei]
MTATGRLAQSLLPRTRRVVYGSPGADDVHRELDSTTTVDLAHVIMLTECGLLGQDAAAALLHEINRLRRDAFRELYGKEAPRGLYLMYEAHLVDRLGAEVGGKLHTGRSRNDLKATLTALRLRTDLADLLGEVLRLQAVLLSRARAHQGVVMPVHTHFQPAMPITYGYYLAGVATALDRDVVALHQALAGLDRCPMGAGAVSGTDLPIEPARTAALLGFAAPPLHATDAVASRDVVLRALAAAAGAGITLSRLATDLQLWSTQEFGFVEFPERLVGGSSALPQKRNAFLLEHVKAKAGAAIGAWTAAAAGMKSTPFTNSIEVGTEAIAGTWAALATVRDSVLLAQVLVSGARPQPGPMGQRARDGFVTATVIANRLVAQGVPFRTAHHAVGAAVREALDAGERDLMKITLPDGEVVDVDPGARVLSEAVVGHTRGGAPGECAAIVRALSDRLADSVGRLEAHRSGLARAESELATSVQEIVGAEGMRTAG